SLLAAVSVGALAWVLGRRITAGTVSGDAPVRRVNRLRQSLHQLARRRQGPSFQAWLSQAGAAVTPREFWAVSAGVGLATLLVLLAVSRTLVVSALPAAASATAPYAYWSAERRKRAAARSAAWPDALRHLVGVLGAGISTLHDGLVQLSTSGPEPLRAPMARYARLSGRLGDRAALEAVRAELADPVSDPVLLAFEGAVDEGTETALRVLADLGSQITGDLQLYEKIRTLQTQSRVATWGCLVLPYAILFFLCATNCTYRQFFSTPVGLVLVFAGTGISLVGTIAARRLVRPIATSERVFAEPRTADQRRMGRLWVS
ncbi:MAG TPA: hypothetical protein VED59_02985, partial [Acidimicrobiales bacterium]|nr:hypothetical protein [Acidimicrobiales bacterium]